MNTKPRKNQPRLQCNIRLTAAEKRTFEAAAARDGRTLSNWIRRVAAAAAVACLFALTSACSAEALAVEPAAPDAPAPTAASTPRGAIRLPWPSAPRPAVSPPDAAPACVPCPDGSHVETIEGMALCVQAGMSLGPVHCVAPPEPVCASPGPDHVQHGSLTEPLCVIDPTSADTRPQCYLCAPAGGCCDCLSGAASVVYCLTTCCTGTI